MGVDWCMVKVLHVPRHPVWITTRACRCGAWQGCHGIVWPLGYAWSKIPLAVATCVQAYVCLCVCARLRVSWTLVHVSCGAQTSSCSRGLHCSNFLYFLVE